MAHRKPVPQDHKQQQGNGNGIADPHIPRYTLTDGPTSPTKTTTTTTSASNTTDEQDSISRAVDQLLKKQFSSSVVDLTLTGNRTQDVDVNDSDVQPLLEHEGLLSRNGSASSGTTGSSFFGEGNSPIDYQQHQQQQQEEAMIPRAPTVPPYQPGQLLPTIITGETLNLDEYEYEYSNNEYDNNQGQGQPDPFSDTHALPHVPLPTTQPYVNYEHDFSEEMGAGTGVPGDGYHYIPPPPQLQDHNQMYQYIPPPTLPLQPDSQPFIDHFNHDTEAHPHHTHAYASGLNTNSYSSSSSSSRRVSYGPPPRSRSPTPAVDDEDYLIVGDDEGGGVRHFRGFRRAEPGGGGWDEEKGGMYHQQDYDLGQGAYLNGRYAEALGQTEPTPDAEKTPISTSDFPLPPQSETLHFGPAPTGRIHRRHKSKKRVQLTNGNLVIDLPVPPNMVLPFEYRGVDEMMMTRYTAVTCDPDEFERKGFFLRQNELFEGEGKGGRRTELFIVVTMYNVCLPPFSLSPFFFFHLSVVFVLFGSAFLGCR